MISRLPYPLETQLFKERMQAVETRIKQIDNAKEETVVAMTKYMDETIRLFEQVGFVKIGPALVIEEKEAPEEFNPFAWTTNAFLRENLIEAYRAMYGMLKRKDPYFTWNEG